MQDSFVIDRLDRQGVGLSAEAEAAGGRRLAPGALPGERVALVETGAKGEARLEILEPSPDRVAPPCRHAARCGGCALQHASEPFLAAWKRRRVVEALARVGLEPEVERTVVSPWRSRRRVKLAARRGKKGVTLGFFGRRSHQIIAVEDCLVTRPEIAAALPALRELAGLAAPRARPIALSVDLSLGGLDVGVAEAKPLDLALTERVVAWAEAADVARLSWNGEAIAARRPAWRRHGAALVAPSAGAFAQATAEGEAALVARVRAGLAGARRVADLFAGAGTFALPLAGDTEVLALEADEGLVAALERGWREADGLKAVRAVRRDLFRRPLRPEEMKGLEGAVIDPPRAGAEAQAAELARAPAALSRLVSVSCDPATFARDARILAQGGWRLGAVTPIDQFLWSPHVELVGLFQR